MKRRRRKISLSIFPFFVTKNSIKLGAVSKEMSAGMNVIKVLIKVNAKNQDIPARSDGIHQLRPPIFSIFILARFRCHEIFFLDSPFSYHLFCVIFTISIIPFLCGAPQKRAPNFFPFVSLLRSGKAATISTCSTTSFVITIRRKKWFAMCFWKKEATRNERLQKRDKKVVVHALALSESSRNFFIKRHILPCFFRPGQWLESCVRNLPSFFHFHLNKFPFSDPLGFLAPTHTLQPLFIFIRKVKNENVSELSKNPFFAVSVRTRSKRLKVSVWNLPHRRFLLRVYEMNAMNASESTKKQKLE